MDIKEKIPILEHPIVLLVFALNFFGYIGTIIGVIIFLTYPFWGAKRHKLFIFLSSCFYALVMFEWIIMPSINAL